MESFKPIPGHLGYEVSDFGTVRSLPRFIRKAIRSTAYECWIKGRTLKPRKHPQGYRTATLGKGKQETIHALVLLAFEGPRPEGAWINHINGDKTDNRLVNLEYCTPKQNQEHAVHTGLAPMPPGAGKLTAEDVVEIKNRLHEGEGGAEIARAFGVTKGCIYSIAHQRSWAWL